MDQSLCLNCGETLTGKFCHKCGQKKIGKNDRTLKHFFYQFFGAAFFLENNFFKNLWYLLVRPGFLASEYIEGRRKRHMPPISLFLLINLFYFFLVFLSDLNLSLTEQLGQPHHKAIAKTLVENRLSSRDIKFDEYEEEYNDQSTSLSKTLIILHAPVLALLLVPLYWKKKFYYTDHVIFSLYLMAFIMLVTILVYNSLFSLARLSLITVSSVFRIAGFIQMIILPVYFAMAVKKVYKQSWFLSITKSVLIIFLFFVAHTVYRTLLFLIVFWST